MNKKDADARKDYSNVKILIRDEDSRRPTPGTGVRGLIRDGQPVRYSDNLLRSLAARKQEASEDEPN